MSYRKEFSEGLNEAEWTFWKLFFRVFIPLTILTTFLGFIGWVVSVPTGVVQRVVNPEAMIHNYEFYESQFQDIGCAADVGIFVCCRCLHWQTT